MPRRRGTPWCRLRRLAEERRSGRVQPLLRARGAQRLGSLALVGLAALEAPVALVVPGIH